MYFFLSLFIFILVSCPIVYPSAEELRECLSNLRNGVQSVTIGEQRLFTTTTKML